MLEYIIENQELIALKYLEHIYIVLVAIGIALLTGIPIGVMITQNEKWASRVLYVCSVIITIPSIALFGIMIPVLSPIGYGIGYVPAVIAIILYSQLPIIRNTYSAIKNIPPGIREAALGMGMTGMQRLIKIEIPNSLPLIMAGARTATVMNIGIAAIATYIGAGGLGSFISRGISQSDSRQLIIGALAISILCIVMDGFLLLIQKLLTPKGIID